MVTTPFNLVCRTEFWIVSIRDTHKWCMEPSPTIRFTLYCLSGVQNFSHAYHTYCNVSVRYNIHIQSLEFGNLRKKSKIRKYLLHSISPQNAMPRTKLLYPPRPDITLINRQQCIQYLLCCSYLATKVSKRLSIVSVTVNRWIADERSDYW